MDEVGIGGKPVSPRLHLSMHEIVANQLWDDEPPQTRQTARRLLALGYERHDVPHMLGSVVAGEVWRVRREDIRSTAHASQRPSTRCPAHGGGSEPAGHQAVEPPVALSEAELAAMDADKLLERCAEQDEASAAAEMGAWRAAHDPTAFAEVARFAQSTSDPGLRMLALAAFDPEDPAAVEVVRGLREDPGARPIRRCGWPSMSGGAACAGRRHRGGAHAAAGRAARARRTSRGAGSGA